MWIVRSAFLYIRILTLSTSFLIIDIYGSNIKAWGTAHTHTLLTAVFNSLKCTSYMNIRFIIIVIIIIITKKICRSQGIQKRL